MFMKVVTAKQMAEIEALAYQDGALEKDFMEAAGQGVANHVIEFIEWRGLHHEIFMLCGKGNNAGDAYVAGRYLLEQGYRVSALQIAPIETCSKLCQENHQHFQAIGGKVIAHTQEMPILFPQAGLILDGIFGTGFKGAATEPYATVIQQANDSGLPIISVDIPSGLNGNLGTVEGPAIQATATIFLQLPKIGFFLEDGWNHVGQLLHVDFGLKADSIAKAHAAMELPDIASLSRLFPKTKRNRHKYERGFVVALAGSPTMPGAALLASTAALKGGAGILRLLSPHGMEQELSQSRYEIIKDSYKYNQASYHEMVELLNKASAAFIGPGIGKKSETIEMLQYILPKITKPCVLDADALTILATTNIEIPKNSILTPHHGEMARLLGKSSLGSITENTLNTCAQYAKEKNIVLVLKGAPTFILYGDQMFVCDRGDPGMATAGSGDVLTGLIASLLAQGLTPVNASICGVFLHAIAGEYAAMQQTSHCMLAHDIIDHFPDAYRMLVQY